MTQILTEQATQPAVRAWTRLVRAYALTTRELSTELQESHGLTVNDFEALLVLAQAESGRLKRVELARTLLLTPSGITRLLRGLEDAGLVERATCATDLRVTYAQITAAGREKLQAAAAAHRAQICELLDEHFESADLELIAEILDKLPGVAEGDGSCSVD
jgi:DNA-binding MarR family transcriptional regulator